MSEEKKYELPGERMDKLEKTITWLAGLLSTDGVVQAGKSKYHQKFCFFAIYSVERPWLEQIKSRLEEVNISSTIHFNDPKHRRIQIHNPRYVRELFLRFNCSRYFNPRKWQRIVNSYNFWSKRMYTPEEKEFISNNLEISDKQLAKYLERTEGSVYGYRIRNGFKKN